MKYFYALCIFDDENAPVNGPQYGIKCSFYDNSGHNSGGYVDVGRDGKVYISVGSDWPDWIYVDIIDPSHTFKDIIGDNVDKIVTADNYPPSFEPHYLEIYTVPGYITTAPTAVSNVKYNSNNYLCTAGSGSGTIMYKLDNGSWSSTRPKASSGVNAGTHTISYYATTNFSSTPPYDSTAPQSFNVTVIKAAQAAPSSVTINTTTYASSGSISGSATGGGGVGTLYYKSDTSGGTNYGSATTTAPSRSRKSVGTTTFVAYWSGNNNYNASGNSIQGKLIVNKADQAAPTTVNGATVNCGNTATATASGGGGQGSIEWSNGSTRTAVGSQTTKARWSGNTNYNASPYSSEVTLKVNALTGATGVSTSAMTITYNTTTGTRSVSGNTGTVTVSSSNTSVATVSISGSTITVTRKGYGSATITCTAAAHECYASKSSTFTVNCNRASRSGAVSCNNVTYGSTVTATVSGNTESGTVTWGITNGTGTATISNAGVITPTKAGTVTVTASVAATTNYAAYTATSKQITISKATGTTGVATSAMTITYSSTTGTRSVSGNTGTVTVSSSNTSVATVSISGSTITVTRKGYGSATITCSAAEATNYAAATSTFKVNCNKASRSGAVSCADTTYPTTVTASVSGNTESGTVTWGITNGTGKATISNGVVTPTQAGTVTVTASVAATTNYLAYTATSKQITISKATGSSGKVSNPAAKTFSTSSQTVQLGISNATGTVTYPTSITVKNSGGTTISGWTCTSAGVVTIPASQTVGTYTVTGKITVATSTNYLAVSATSKSWTVTINKASRSGSVSCSNTTYPTTVTATVSGNTESGTVTWGITNGTGTATISNGVVTPTKAGTVTVTASVAATTNYAAYTATSKQITISKASISPTVSCANPTYGGGTKTATVSGNTGSGTVTWSSSDTSVATVNSSTGVVTPVKAGTTRITATIAESTNYLAGSGYKDITIGKASQPMTISPTSKTIYSRSGYNTFTITPSSAQGAVNYSSSDTSKATVSSVGVVTYKAAGSVTITVTAAGNDNYNSGSKTCEVTCVVDSVSSYGTPGKPTITQISNFPAGGVTLSTSNISTYFSYSTVTQGRTWASGYTDTGGTVTYSWVITTGSVASLGTTETSELTSRTIKCTITASGEGSKSNSNTVSSGKQETNPVTSISLAVGGSTSSKTIPYGSSVTTTVTATYKSGSTATVTPTSVTSSDTTVAKVS